MVMALSGKLSYPVRLFIWLLGYSLLLVVCFVLFQYHREKAFKIGELNSRLQMLNSLVLDRLDAGESVGSCRDIVRLPGLDDLRLSIIDENGNVLYDNTLDSIPGSNHRNRTEIRDALRYGDGYTVRRHSESTGLVYFYSATRGIDGTVVRTAVPYTLSHSDLLKADYGFLWIMGIITFVMCILGYIATRRVGQHITRLTLFARRAERGERIYDTEPFPHDELGEISNNIVRLYVKFQQANAERDREHRAAMREQHEKERIKKQLTNNINHELKTPVAAMQACLETLLEHPDMDEKRRRDFLSRCLASNGRLRNLLDDVSLITRMDDGGTAIVRERLDIMKIIAEVVAECEPMAEIEGMEIRNHIDRQLESEGNPLLLASVFRNLIVNAVTYSGGTMIELRLLGVHDGMAVIRVADDGTGVGAEHLDRLFERFYRVDKGRSRARGGTGLGLAIVKNAILMHGDTVTAVNRIPHGLEFNITLPLLSV